MQDGEDGVPRVTPKVPMPDGMRYDLPVRTRTVNGVLHATLRIRVIDGLGGEVAHKVSILWRVVPSTARSEHEEREEGENDDGGDDDGG